MQWWLSIHAIAVLISTKKFTRQRSNYHTLFLGEIVTVKFLKEKRDGFKKGLSIKDVRPEVREGGLQMRSSVFFGVKNFRFFEIYVPARTRRRGGPLRTRGLIYRNFVWMFYGRPKFQQDSCLENFTATISV